MKFFNNIEPIVSPRPTTTTISIPETKPEPETIQETEPKPSTETISNPNPITLEPTTTQSKPSGFRDLSFLDDPNLREKFIIDLFLLDQDQILKRDFFTLYIILEE